MKTLIIIAISTCSIFYNSECYSQTIPKPKTYFKSNDIELGFPVPEHYTKYIDPDIPLIIQHIFQRSFSKEEIKQKLLRAKMNLSFMERWDTDDYIAEFSIQAIKIIKGAKLPSLTKSSIYLTEGQDHGAAHKLICENFRKYWGEYVFDFYDRKKKIGHCINYAGVYITLYTYQVDNVLVIADGTDILEALIFEQTDFDNFTELNDEEKWKQIRRVGNADTIELLLPTIQIKQ